MSIRGKSGTVNAGSGGRLVVPNAPNNGPLEPVIPTHIKDILLRKNCKTLATIMDVTGDSAYDNLFILNNPEPIAYIVNKIRKGWKLSNKLVWSRDVAFELAEQVTNHVQEGTDCCQCSGCSNTGCACMNSHITTDFKIPFECYHERDCENTTVRKATFPGLYLAPSFGKLEKVGIKAGHPVKNGTIMWIYTGDVISKRPLNDDYVMFFETDVLKLKKDAKHRPYAAVDSRKCGGIMNFLSPGKEKNANCIIFQICTCNTTMYVVKAIKDIQEDDWLIYYEDNADTKFPKDRDIGIITIGNLAAENQYSWARPAGTEHLMLIERPSLIPKPSSSFISSTNSSINASIASSRSSLTSLTKSKNTSKSLGNILEEPASELQKRDRSKSTKNLNQQEKTNPTPTEVIKEKSKTKFRHVQSKVKESWATSGPSSNINAPLQSTKAKSKSLWNIGETREGKEADKGKKGTGKEPSETSGKRPIPHSSKRPIPIPTIPTANKDNKNNKSEPSILKRRTEAKTRINIARYFQTSLANFTEWSPINKAWEGNPWRLTLENGNAKPLPAAAQESLSFYNSLTNPTSKQRKEILAFNDEVLNFVSAYIGQALFRTKRELEEGGSSKQTKTGVNVYSKLSDEIQMVNPTILLDSLTKLIQDNKTRPFLGPPFPYTLAQLKAFPSYVVHGTKKDPVITTNSLPKELKNTIFTRICNKKGSLLFGNYHGSTLHYFDLFTLRPKQWLSINIMDGVLGRIAAQSQLETNDLQPVNHFEYAVLAHSLQNGWTENDENHKGIITRMRNMGQTRGILVPILENNNHWTLAIIKPSDLKIRIYDPKQPTRTLGEQRRQNFIQQISRLTDIVKASFDITDEDWNETNGSEWPNSATCIRNDNLIQNDGHSCGPFCLAFAEDLVNPNDIQVDNDPTRIRTNILREILGYAELPELRDRHSTPPQE